MKDQLPSTMASQSQGSRRNPWLRITLAPVAVVFFSIAFILIVTMNYVVVDQRLLPQNPTPAVIRLNTNNELNLAIFSDLHFGEEEGGWGIEQDANTTRVMEDILDLERPNLVVLNGDLITGENTYLHNSTSYIDQIVRPMVDRNIPWASTYGNHDSQFNLSREALYSAEARYSLSKTGHSPYGTIGVTNYYLPIYPAANSPNSHLPIMILWFFDSQGGAPFRKAVPEGAEVPNWVDDSAIDWFLGENRNIEEKWGQLPSLVFVHIPPGSFRDFQDEQHSSANFPGLNADVPLAQQSDPVQGRDTNFMLSLIATPKIHSIYSGHDHGNAWCGNWPNSTNTRVKGLVSSPHVCFSKHTGYGGYGDWNRGSRILKLGFEYPTVNSTDLEEKLTSANASLSVDTWVRMENGDVITHVNLNSTYGQAVYPTADGQ